MKIVGSSGKVARQYDEAEREDFVKRETQRVEAEKAAYEKATHVIK